MSTVSSLLSTVGLGPPNPAAYSDASAVASQQTQAVSGLSSTVGTIGTTLSVLKATGASSTSIDKVSALQTQANTLLSQSSTMTPAALEAKRAKIQADLIATQTTAVQEQYTTILGELRAKMKEIGARVAVVTADTTTSKDLSSQYKTLLTDISGAVSLLVASPPTFTTGTSGSSGSGPAVSTYVIPTTPSAADFQAQLDALDSAKDTETGGTFNYERTMRHTRWWIKTYVVTPLFAIFIALSMILAGSIASNAYVSAEKGYLMNRIFYFVYGALGFPLTILSACIKPPFWVSFLFPAYPRPNVDAGGNLIKQAGGFLSLPQVSLQQLANTAVQPLAIKGLIPTPPVDTSSLSSMTSSLTGKSSTTPTDTYTGTPSTTAIDTTATRVPIFKESGTSIVPSLSLMDSLFSFVLVDPAKPPTYQVANKKTLWYLSLAFEGTLLSMAIAYGLM